MSETGSENAGSTHPRSVGLRNTGIAFTIVGPVMGLVGAALLAGDEESLVAGLFLAPVGASLLLLGVPMWGLGAQEIPANMEPESMGALVAGVVLSGLGLSGLAVGSTFFLATSDNALPSVPMIIGGGMLVGGLAAGIYGIGSTPIANNTVLRVGPGSLDLTHTW